MLFFVENNFTFSLPLKDWQTCILVKKYSFWDKYFSNKWCARGSYKTCVYCDLVLPHLPNGTLKGLLQIPASQLPMRGSSPWSGNLTFRMLLWIHQQNLTYIIFSQKFFFEPPASDNLFLITMSTGNVWASWVAAHFWNSSDCLDRAHSNHFMARERQHRRLNWM